MYPKKKVYNFEVADWHTYFVGAWEWLVHNAGEVCIGLTKKFKHAGEYGFDSYNALRKAILEKVGKGSGLEVHHLLEKRFRKFFKPPPSAGSMIAMVLTKAEHRVFTNAWRTAFPYGQKIATKGKKQFKNVAKEVYKDYPEILKALGL